MLASKNKPVISIYILLIFLLTRDLFNDINTTTTSTTWDSKMVSACLCDLSSTYFAALLQTRCKTILVTPPPMERASDDKDVHDCSSSLLKDK